MPVIWVICPLVERLDKPTVFRPAIVETLETINRPYVAEWSTTDAQRSNHYAIGVFSLDVAQQAAVDADTRVVTFFPVELNAAISSLSLDRVTKLNLFADRIGIVRPLASSGIGVVLQQILNLDEPMKNLENLQARLTTRLGT